MSDLLVHQCEHQCKHLYRDTISNNKVRSAWYMSRRVSRFVREITRIGLQQCGVWLQQRQGRAEPRRQEDQPDARQAGAGRASRRSALGAGAEGQSGAKRQRLR